MSKFIEKCFPLNLNSFAEIKNSSEHINTLTAKQPPSPNLRERERLSLAVLWCILAVKNEVFYFFPSSSLGYIIML